MRTCTSQSWLAEVGVRLACNTSGFDPGCGTCTFFLLGLGHIFVETPPYPRLIVVYMYSLWLYEMMLYFFQTTADTEIPPEPEEEVKPKSPKKKGNMNLC